MKFAWGMMTVDNLWTILFMEKYVKFGHMVTMRLNLVGLRFWKVILKVVLEVYENGYVKI